MSKLRIGVDARLSVGAFRGMGRYVREFVAQCDQNVVWLGHAGQVSDPLIDRASGPAFYPLWEQVELPRLCSELDLDAVLCPYNTGPTRRLARTKLFIVVHDLIFLESRRAVPYGGSLYQVAGRMYRRLIVPKAVGRADAIITVSQYSARALVQRLCIKAKPLIVVPNTVEASWFLAPSCREPGGNCILTVSGEAPHKNLARVIKAFRQARVAGDIPARVPLRIAGVSEAGRSSVMRLAAEHGVADAVEVLPYLPLAEMQTLYRTAAFLVFPSLVEGFGIPILEAMACGCPVITSNCGALPEVAGGAALTVDPLNEHEIAAAMSRLWSDRALQLELAVRGAQNAQRFHPCNVHPQMRVAWQTLYSLCR